jgi:hypothetical protein
MDITEEMLAFACNKCELKFVSKKIMSNHRSQHEKECKLCYKFIKHQSDMDRHIRFVHKGDEELVNRDIAASELTHACNTVTCQKKFASENILKYHSKIHQALKQNTTCKLCYKTFRIEKILERHIVYAHKNDTAFLGRDIAESELKHACKFCPKKFVKESILFKHNIDHDTQNHEYLRKDCYIKESKGRRFAC